MLRQQFLGSCTHVSTNDGLQNTRLEYNSKNHIVAKPSLLFTTPYEPVVAQAASTKQKTRCQFANSIVLVHHDQSCFSMFGISKLTHLAHESAQPCGSAVNLPNFGGCFLG
jgi:hypothetical protein